MAAMRETGPRAAHELAMTVLSNTKSQVEFRRATPQDYSAIVRLQTENFIANLSDEERKEGFLSAQFTPEQIAAMAEDLGTTVAIVGKDMAGFVCAFRREFDTGSPVIAKMLESYDLLRFEGTLLSRYRSYLYGPVCIGRLYRRRGLLRGLYHAQIAELTGQFEVGAAFVARNNPHSLAAHVGGLGMTVVGDFEVKGNRYALLAFRVPDGKQKI